MSKELENLPIKKGITETLKTNYMPYAMAVIVSRAIPQIDGFKPSHRKLLYTMYNMGLLKGNLMKSNDIVGQTMRLSPHGDIPIYETMVRLTRGNQSLLHPLIESKGNFGRVYARDLSFAASRYTEATLAPICAEVFKNIEKENVDFIDNYNSTMKEPVLLPVTYPNILVTPNMGIAVGMASNICSFNLREICAATTAYIDDPTIDLLDYIQAPDFSTGGEIIYDQEVMKKIYETGRGSFKIRGKYHFDRKTSTLEITEIPYTTTIEHIIDKIIDMAKSGDLREINGVRDETGLHGLRIAIDLKRNTDHELVMQKIFQSTSLTDSFACNFNILVNGQPKVMGIKEILYHWLAFRKETVKRESLFDLHSYNARLHVLKGLALIILDIDKAIAIIRETTTDNKVLSNLMNGFQIDEEQAEYIANIRLRNLNKEFLLRQIKEQAALEKKIANLEKLLGSEKRMRKFIQKELEEVAKNYGMDRKTGLILEDQVEILEDTDFIDDYSLKLFFTQENYFKKISLVSLRSSGEQMVKDGDEIIQEIESTNKADILFFTNQHNVYKMKAYEMADGIASQLGDYLPATLELKKNELVVYMCSTMDYTGHMIFAFENGKIAKVDMKGYYTKTNRKRLLNAYSNRFPLIFAHYATEDEDIVLFRDEDKAQLIHTSLFNMISAKDSVGVQVFNLKQHSHMTKAMLATNFNVADTEFYRRTRFPSTGFFIADADRNNPLFEDF